MLRDISILVFITVVMTLAVAAYSSDAAGSILLRERAEVSIGQVMLADIAVLDEGVRPLGGVVVATLQGHVTQVTVTLADVRRALDERGVHWGRVSLRGYRACTVTREGVAATTATPVAVDPSPATTDEAQPLANVHGEIDARRANTLEEVVVDRIAVLAGVPRDELVVSFGEGDRRLLSASIIGARYEIEPMSGTGLGLVPVTIRRYRAQSGVTETLRVKAEVAHRTLAVVVKQSVSRGQTFVPGDVEVREVMLTSPHGRPMTDLDMVIGQTAAALLRDGAVLYPEHLRSPVMVRRGQLVTVRALAGGLVVRTVCRAAEDGTLGDLIHVRNERSKQTLTVRVTGMQEAAVELDLVSREGGEL
jgi:flagella basal body P-ring formation protein FlgA